MELHELKDQRLFVQQLIENNEGWLPLTGIGITRAVYIDTLEITPEYSRHVRDHSVEFNWGYSGSGPAQLALAVLLLVLPKDEAVSLYQTFKATTIAILPQESFGVSIDIRRWLTYLRSQDKPKTVKEAHAYSFMRFTPVSVSDGTVTVSEAHNYYSKFIDFPFIGIKTATFDNDTIEYQLIKELHTDEKKLALFKSYCANYTGHIHTKKAVEIEYDENNDRYLVYGGNGSLVGYNGHKI